MRPIARPPFTTLQVLDLCIKSIRDNDLTDRLRLTRDQMNSAEADYVGHAEGETLYSIAQTMNVGGVTVDEMKRVYKDTFAKSKGTRHIYDAIKKAPPNDICPLCGQRTVGTVDHYLPQSKHAALVVTPVNLLPSCADCNKAKLDSQPTSLREQTLHPYFDDFDGEKWLFAQTEERSPAALLFFPRAPAAWSDPKKERLLLHFRTFGLAALYASHSGVELTNIRYGLERIAERGSPAEIREELRRRADSSRAAHKNSWQTAMYDSISSSDWFCGGGFR